jgi:orotate phosphoribosyltransferase
VRKERKERGSKKLLEGCELNKDDKVIIVEDVTTTGGSVLNAIRAVQNEGCTVVKVLSIIDRLEGARENLAKEGIALDSIFTKNDFLKNF